MKIFLEKLENGITPKKQTIGSSGYDVYSNESAIIKPMQVKLIRLGFKIAIEKGYEAQIRSRSGLALKNQIFILNSPGTIDSDYREEVGALLMNLGDKEYKIRKGDRIAQMVFSKIYNPSIQEVIKLDNKEERSGGWGSTGK